MTLLTLTVLLRQSACNQDKPGEEVTKEDHATKKEQLDTKVIMSREAQLGATTLRWEKRSDQSIHWNEEAMKAASGWKADSVRENGTARNAMAEFLDADSSLILGLSADEIEAFLGPQEGPEDRFQYRYDKHYTGEDQYMGCWLVIFMNEQGKAKDVARMCP